LVGMPSGRGINIGISQDSNISLYPRSTRLKESKQEDLEASICPWTSRLIDESPNAGTNKCLLDCLLC
jgi:hypothetical protein